MRLYCITCSACGAIYKVAESETAVGFPGVKNCSACGATLASWSDRKLKALAGHAAPLPACAGSALTVKAKSENRGGTRNKSAHLLNN
jgi:hypothetical protein